MVVPTFNSSSWEAEVGGSRELEASMVYTEKSCLAKPKSERFWILESGGRCSKKQESVCWGIGLLEMRSLLKSY